SGAARFLCRSGRHLCRNRPGRLCPQLLRRGAGHRSFRTRCAERPVGPGPWFHGERGPMSVLVLDFGSQVTQLIARRVREAGVYWEIVPFNKADEALAKKPQAIILSGGPASAMEEGAPRAPQAVFDAGVPVLGICYRES